MAKHKTYAMSGQQGHHETKLHQKGMHRKSPSGKIGHPKGPTVDHGTGRGHGHHQRKHRS